MKLPVIQRFQKQNYPGSPDWFTRFISDMNSFTEIVWNILNRNVTPGDNLDAQIYTTSLLAGTDPEDNTFQFQSELNHTPTCILVGNVVDRAAYQAPLTTAVGVQWSVSGDTITVAGVAGLVTGQTYDLTLLVF